MTPNHAVWIAAIALAWAGVSPLALALYMRHAHRVDLRKDKERREEEMLTTAEALHIAQRLGGLLSSVLDSELEASWKALRAMEETVHVKEQGGVPVLDATHDAITMLQEQVVALTNEIKQRRVATENARMQLNGGNS